MRDSTSATHCRTLFPVPPKKDNLFKLFLAQIRRIPRGKVATYGDIAYAAGYPGYARQVAWALHGGGSSVPWQRVVGSGGKILLTGEHGFEQRFRLEAEGVRLIGLRVDMKLHHHLFFKKRASKLKKKATRFSLTKKPARPAAKNAKKKTTPKRRVAAKQSRRK
jgi:methylated-DNA-protein-cysteine methyltransferase-like protein